MKLKNLAGILLGAFVTLATADSRPFKSEIDSEKNIRPLRESKNLVVNTGNKVRNYTNKSEKEGIKNLWCHSLNSKFEEGWYYFPKKKQYVEYGVDETSGSAERVNTETAEAFKNNSSIVDFHIHPYKRAELVVEDLNKVAIEDLYDGKLRGFSIEDLIEIDQKIKMCPSATDLDTMITYSIGFYAIHPRKNILPKLVRTHGLGFHVIIPTGEISYKVVSEYGVTKFSLTKEGARYFLEDKNKIAEYISDYYYHIVTAHPKRVEQQRLLSMLEHMLKLENYVNQKFELCVLGFAFLPDFSPKMLSDDKVKIAFTPIEEIFDELPICN